jgi:glycogen operon protein
LALRGRQRRNFMATLLLSQGVPMIGHGDELGRTQRGNNNAYCQDSELSWVDWDNVDATMLEFTRMLIRFRAANRAFLRRRFLTGRPVRRGATTPDTPVPDVAWFASSGRLMTMENWTEDLSRAVSMFLNGQAIRERGPRGEQHSGSSFMLCFNAHPQWFEFTMPPPEFGEKWHTVIDTSQPTYEEPPTVNAGESLWVPDRCLLVLEQVR